MYKKERLNNKEERSKQEQLKTKEGSTRGNESRLGGKRRSVFQIKENSNHRTTRKDWGGGGEQVA